VKRPAGVIVLGVWFLVVAADAAIHTFEHVQQGGRSGEIGEHLFTAALSTGSAIGLFLLRPWGQRMALGLCGLGILGGVSLYSKAVVHAEHTSSSYLGAIAIWLMSLLYLVLPRVRQAFGPQQVPPAPPPG